MGRSKVEGGDDGGGEDERGGEREKILGIRAQRPGISGAALQLAPACRRYIHGGPPTTAARRAVPMLWLCRVGAPRAPSRAAPIGPPNAATVAAAGRPSRHCVADASRLRRAVSRWKGGRLLSPLQPAPSPPAGSSLNPPLPTRGVTVRYVFPRAGRPAGRRAARGSAARAGMTGERSPGGTPRVRITGGLRRVRIECRRPLGPRQDRVDRLTADAPPSRGHHRSTPPRIEMHTTVNRFTQ